MTADSFGRCLAEATVDISLDPGQQLAPDPIEYPFAERTRILMRI